MQEPTDVFPWNENFATGISQIDEQHQRLVHLLNDVARQVVLKSDRLTFENVFAELTAYASYHFETEEAVWQSYLSGDDWESQHRKSHEEFGHSVSELMAAQGRKPLGAVLEDVLSFLARWLVHHILESDKRLAFAALAVQRGCSVEEAKRVADQEMGGAMRLLIETVLSMYEDLTSRTLQLMREVVQRKQAEARLRLAGNVLEHTLDAICITDQQRLIVEANPAFCASCGLRPEKVLGRPLAEIKSALGASEEIWDVVAEKGHWSGEVSDRGLSGECDTSWLALSSIVNDDGGVMNYVAVFSNVAGLIKRRKELERLANHDALTGLPNRLGVSDLLELSLAQAERAGRRMAVCFLDLDGFKDVNDQLGHNAGDSILKEITGRLLQLIRREDTLARHGGDEFVLLIGNMADPRDCETILKRLIKEVRRPVHLSGRTASVSASVGVAVFPDDARDGQTLITLADQAMYEAKKTGKSKYFFYSQSSTPLPATN